MADELADLIALMARGDRQAFATLYERTSPRLFTLALAVLRNRDSAQEVLQEAYISIWRAADRYHPSKGSVQVWLNVIVRNRCIDSLRQHQHEHDEVSLVDWEALVCDRPSPPQALQSQHEAEDLARCMAGLDAPQQRALTLAFFHGLSHRELAEQLNTPLGSIKSRVRRGLANLRRCLHHATDS